MSVDALLKDEKLLDIILDELSKKIEGERDSCHAILLHLMACRVKNLSSVPHVFVNSESSAGKSYICKKIYDILPPEWCQYRTKITPEAFTYWHNKKSEPDWTWEGKICYLEDVRDELTNSPTFKVMASEGSLATVVIKNKAIDIEIAGHPVMMITSASAQPSAEILNRFSIINLDETPEQTSKIMKKQAREAIIVKYEYYDQRIIEALKLISIVDVRLPEWIGKTAGYFPKEIMRMRRDYPRFLDLMKASAALFQYQREFDVLTKTVWANEKDYENACKAYQKIDAAGGIFGLTHRAKKCYFACLAYFKEKEEGITPRKIYSKEPIISERRWYDMLERLAAGGLLQVSLEKNEETGRSRAVFYPTFFNKINLPLISDLN
jgi:hypothetical protein